MWQLIRSLVCGVGVVIVGITKCNPLKLPAHSCHGSESGTILHPGGIMEISATI